MKWSYFVEGKDELAERVTSNISELKLMDKTFKYIRCDKDGENQVLKNYFIKKEIKNVKVEFSTPGTSQQNGVVERAFAFLYDRIRAMLNQAGVKNSMQSRMWVECAQTEVSIDNILIKDKKCNYEKFMGYVPKMWHELRNFGEMVVTKNHKDKLKAKLDDRGNVGIFVGYEEDHAAEA